MLFLSRVTLIYLATCLIPIFCLECGQIPRPILAPDTTYVPVGKDVILAGLDTYQTGDIYSTKVIIASHDIFGAHPMRDNIHQISDYYGKFGYRVVLPDFFHGNPWTGHGPPNGEEFIEFQKKDFHTWANHIRDDIGDVIKELKSQGAKEFAIFGPCFGGTVAALAATTFSDIKLAGQFHPRDPSILHAPLIKSPTLILNGANDPDMTEYCKIVENNLGKDSCVFHHFFDVNHGWTGPFFGDWTNATIKSRAEDAVEIFHGFMCNHGFIV